MTSLPWLILVSLSVCLSVCLFACLSVWVFVRLSVCPYQMTVHLHTSFEFKTYTKRIRFSTCVWKLYEKCMKVSRFELCLKKVYESCTENVRFWTLKNNDVQKLYKKCPDLDFDKKRCMEVVWKVYGFHDVQKLYGKCLIFEDSLTLEEEIVFQKISRR